LLSEYSRLDVPWKSDEEAAVRWILERRPDFFSTDLPFIGYIEFLFEGSIHGGQRIRTFEASVSYGMSGLHSPPKDRNAYKDRDSSPWRFRAGGGREAPGAEPRHPDAATNIIIPGEILSDPHVDSDTRSPSQRAVDEGHALGALESFLGALASKDFKTAYGLVAPRSKKHGDPIAYRAPLGYAAFLKELSPHGKDDASPPDTLQKFTGYELGARRWESPIRLRVLVTFQGWDRDDVLIVREDSKWYIADPIHIIR
jgi:hypothetical protein